MEFPLPDSLRRILNDPALSGSVFLVGGCVRDWLMERPVRDYDIEVYGKDEASLMRLLSSWGRVDQVGRSFGIIKLTVPGGESFDFSLPRRDSKTGSGHKGFEVALDPRMPLKEAAGRRDFTINALMYEPRKGRLLDFFDGVGDLKKRVLRHTSPAFIEDPLRVLRGLQLTSRFSLRVHEKTIELCRRMKANHAELAVQRVRDEWLKWASVSERPSAGLQFLRQTGWIEFYPEILALVNTPQDPEWHPEGDVFVHTCLCCDALAQSSNWATAPQDQKIVTMFATLGHDFGKPATTQRLPRQGRERLVSPGHDRSGGPLVDRFLQRFDLPESLRVRVVRIVENHLVHLQPVSGRSLRRLSRRLEPATIEELCLVMAADHAGRPPRSAAMPANVRHLRDTARRLHLETKAPEPILKGRHLIELGLIPGPRFGVILRRAYDAQLEEAFAGPEEGKQWLIREGYLAR